MYDHTIKLGTILVSCASPSRNIEGSDNVLYTTRSIRGKHIYFVFTAYVAVLKY